MAVVPVLMYHHVNPNRGDMITVTPEVFEAQMRHIKEAGYRTLTLDELLGFIEGRLTPEGKAVAITFDDGYLDNYIYAYPVLKRYGLKAAIFIVTDWVDKASAVKDKSGVVEGFKKQPLTHAEAKALVDRGELEKVSVDWAMVEEMEGTIEFHSHTKTHRSCDKLDVKELAAELNGSKEAIEKRLKKGCDFLCWPKGRFNDGSVKAAKGAGYKGLFTTAPGVAERGTDPHHIKRIVVKDGKGWLKSRLRLYTSPMLSKIYLKLKR